MTSFLNKGRVTKLECNIHAEPPETKAQELVLGLQIPHPPQTIIID